MQKITIHVTRDELHPADNGGQRDYHFDPNATLYQAVIQILESGFLGPGTGKILPITERQNVWFGHGPKGPICIIAVNGRRVEMATPPAYTVRDYAESSSYLPLTHGWDFSLEECIRKFKAENPY